MWKPSKFVSKNNGHHGNIHYGEGTQGWFHMELYGNLVYINRGARLGIIEGQVRNG
jgi:hypothetical protein